MFDYDIEFSGEENSPEPNLSIDKYNSDVMAGYQCTFCCKRFRVRWQWRRYEESIHAPQKVWICGPPPALSKGHADEPTDFCPICRVTSADQSQCRHKFGGCWQKSQEERTFYRKDALAQHVRLVHCGGENHRQLNLNTWKQEVGAENYNLVCGFCGVQNMSWNARVKHVALHFEQGLSMVDWNRKIE